jgi:hypothetical protein
MKERTEVDVDGCRFEGVFQVVLSQLIRTTLRGPVIIARVPHLDRLVALAALIVGLVAWVFYLNEGLILAHYDAKAHLVVARRVIDSLTPGWRQIGAVWLPLPHLLQILPTQIDVLYRTGAFGSLLSIACFATAAAAMAQLVLSVTGSRLGAVVAAALFVLNPNLVYVHVTPMTEPLLLAATFAALAMLHSWLATAATERVPSSLGWVLFLAMWTRYEAWPVVAAAIALTAVALWRQGHSFGVILIQTWRLVRWPAAAVVIFLLLSRATVGAWFVTGGFYERDPTYDSQIGKTLLAIWWGTHRLSGYVIEATALVTAVIVVLRAVQWRTQSAHLVTVACLAAAALPAYAFFEAHPFRIRYMVPLVGACALLCGIAVGTISSASRRASPAAWLMAALLMGSTAIESPLWNRQSPLIVEAQLDAANGLGREQVTACLAPAYRGEKVLVSMGSLAHYMQELSRDGLFIADFLHEGNGALWDFALETGPAPHAGWMLVEEQSEGGDVLARRVRRHDGFTRGMIKVCEGGGVSLYRRE